jgi:hypothetical protein
MKGWVLLTSAAIGVGLAGAASAAPIGYSLGDNGSTLVTMTDLSNPGMVSGIGLADSMNAGVSLNSLAYRPMTRQLYGYSNFNNTVYLVDPPTGKVSSVASTADGTNVAEIGFDFNNTLDAARIVSSDEDNLVFFPNNSPANISRFTSLFYEPGDVNAGRDPSVFANAYTNAVPNASTTQQFVLDGEWDLLATLDNNNGGLTTIGGIFLNGTPLDFTNTGGFDVLSFAEGDNTAYALLTTVTGTGLYGIDLMADSMGRVNASFIGMAGTNFGPLDGLAIAPNAIGPNPSEVPVPASALLLASGIAGVAAIRRRRK